MKVLASLLKKYIDLPETPQEVAELFQRAGIEVENIEYIEPLFDGVVIATVVKAEKHPKADRLSVAEVFDGKNTYTVVCGAPNCRAGIVVAFAPVGSKLYPEGRDKACIDLKHAEIRGVASAGMLLSEKELGLSTNEDKIVELESFKPGTLFADCIRDVCFELGITANLGHVMSVRGLARELAAQTGRTLYHDPWLRAPFEQLRPYPVIVAAHDVCPRYCCLAVEGLKSTDSPFALRHILEGCGIRSVNAIVDITNMVLLELGQPLHAFDRDKIEGDRLAVRKATREEGMLFLDGIERKLPAEALVIADDNGPVALAGVMGGARSMVSETTSRIVIESAFFQPAAIRRSSKACGISTESSRRFERGIDPEMAALALRYAFELIRELYPEATITDYTDIKTREFEPVTIACRLKRCTAILGYEVSRGELDSCFSKLQFGHEWDGIDTFQVHVPSYRHDIKEEIDLIEDVAKLMGYAAPIEKPSYYSGSTAVNSPLFLGQRAIRKRLIASGLQEFITCDLISPEMVDSVLKHPIQPENLVKMLNPLSQEQSVLRPSLLPGLLQVVKHNVNQRNLTIKGFELGTIHLKQGVDVFEELPVLGIIMTGVRDPNHFENKPSETDFYDLKGVIENFISCFGKLSVKFTPSDLSTFHPGRQALVTIGSLQIGMCGEIHPSLQRKLDVQERIYFAEFDVEELLKLERKEFKMESLPLYPASERDWTVTVPESVTYGMIEEALLVAKTPLLEEYSIVAVYRSDKLGIGKKNITLHFVYRSKDKTVSQIDVDTEHARLIAEIGSRIC